MFPITKALSPLIWWNDFFGTRPLSKIKREDVLAGLNQLNDGKRSPATLNRYLELVRSAFELVTIGGSHHNEWLESNPARIKKFHMDNRRSVILDDEQAARLLSACGKSECEDLLLIVLIAIATGARQGNIMSLRWDRLDLKTGRIDVPASEMKNGKRFATLIRGEALELLRHRRKQLDKAKVRNLYNGQFVFPSGRSRSHMDFPAKFWKAALKKAGIKWRRSKRDPNNTGFRFHDLRHTFATKMAVKGATQQQLMKLMGHASPTMTTRYVEMDLSDVEHLFD